MDALRRIKHLESSQDIDALTRLLQYEAPRYSPLGCLLLFVVVVFGAFHIYTAGLRGDSILKAGALIIGAFASFAWLNHLGKQEESDSVAVRIAAVQALERLDTTHATIPLLHLLSHSGPWESHVKQVCVNALWNSKALAHLCDLTVITELHVAKMAKDAFARIFGEDTSELVLSQRSPHDAKYLCTILAARTEDSFLSRLIATLSHDHPQWELAFQLLQLKMDRSGHRGILWQVLEKALAGEFAPRLRASVLGFFEGKRGRLRLLDIPAKIIDQVKANVKSSDKVLQAFSIYFLIETVGIDGNVDAIEAACESADPMKRAIGIRSLRSTETNAQKITILKRALNDTLEGNRVEAVRSIDLESLQPAAAELLECALNDQIGAVRAAALARLPALNTSRRTFESLSQGLKDPDPLVQEAAKKCLLERFEEFRPFAREGGPAEMPTQAAEIVRSALARQSRALQSMEEAREKEKRRLEQQEAESREDERRTGRCSLCHGTGSIPCGHLDHRGDHADCTGPEKCPGCGGSGKV